MSIKYADITVIRNINEETIFQTMSRYFGYEDMINSVDTIIIQFDDNTICEIKDEYKDKKYKFGTLGYKHNFPIYFDTNKGVHLYFKNPIKKNDQDTLNFSSIFKDYPNFKNHKNIASIYNIIYEDISKKEQFALLKRSSNEEKPRYIVAYNNTIFDKSDIIYFIYYLLKEKETN